MLEKEIEKKVCDYAKQLGCYVRKFTSPQQRGVPDRIIIAPGGAVGFLELKAAGKKPTALQEMEMRKLGEIGVLVDWCDNVKAGCAFVDLLRLKGVNAQRAKDARPEWQNMGVGADGKIHRRQIKQEDDWA